MTCGNGSARPVCHCRALGRGVGVEERREIAVDGADLGEDGVEVAEEPVQEPQALGVLLVGGR
jgi:hypothetical protein